MKRVEKLLKVQTYQEYLLKNEAFETDRRFCKHNFQHVLDVARVTYILLLEAGETEILAETCGLAGVAAVKEVVYAAGLVHDIARWLQYETGEDHAAAGAVLAEPLLEQAGFNYREITAITAAVREHRTAAVKHSLLGQRLCRADDLSRSCFRCGAREDCYKYIRNGSRGKALAY